MAMNTGEIFSATYSSVPVYEFNIDGNHVMRRRCDDYINATHILKVADYDKPARTRILEREVQKGKHEKIQGGYGKYQGTWIPLNDGKILAQRNHVYEKLQPIFDYVASNVSPPPAPKHSTNPSRPKVPKVPGIKRGSRAPKRMLMSDDYDNMSTQLQDVDSQDAETIDSASYMDGDDGYGSQYMQASKRQKRGTDASDLAYHQHTLFADAMLDYFVMSADGPSARGAPSIPPTFELDRPIDDQGHTVLHWAAAMGDIGVVRTLVERGANVKARNKRGETPLIRAVIFTNNYEKGNMEHLVGYLQASITDTDIHGASVLHHTVMTTSSRARRKPALHYLRILLDALNRMHLGGDFERFLDHQDENGGDTALHIASRLEAKRCFKILQQYGAHTDIPNNVGATPDQLFSSLRSMNHDLISSSPPPMDMDHSDGLDGMKSSRATVMSHYHAAPARSFSQSFDSLAQEKSLQIALAIEKEWRDKNTALEEAQQAVNKAELERQQVHQATLQYLTQDTTNDDEELARLEQEFEVLKQHGQAFSEQMQHRELHASIREAESLLPAAAHRPQSNEPLEDRIQAGLELALEQDKRRKLTTDIIEAKALAGMSPIGEALKRLVADTTGITVDEVVHLAPELLEELQDSKMDMSGIIPVGA